MISEALLKFVCYNSIKRKENSKERKENRKITKKKNNKKKREKKKEEAEVAETAVEWFRTSWEVHRSFLSSWCSVPQKHGCQVGFTSIFSHISR